MQIFNKLNQSITSLDTWEEAFIAADDSIHWKVGRSAYCLAKYFCKQEGVSKGEERLIKFIQASLRTESEVKLLDGRIEYESKFDNYAGKGRVHDLAVWGEVEGQRFFAGIEAKVDESFNKTVLEAYDAAEKALKENPRSNAVSRIDHLVERFFPGKSMEEIGGLRYQLIYYLAGSIAEANIDTGTVFMPVMVFHTPLFNSEMGDRNRSDYLEFIHAVGFHERGCGVFYLDIDGIDVYSSYIEIDLPLTVCR